MRVDWNIHPFPDVSNKWIYTNENSSSNCTQLESTSLKTYAACGPRCGERLTLSNGKWFWNTCNFIIINYHSNELPPNAMRTREQSEGGKSASCISIAIIKAVQAARCKVPQYVYGSRNQMLPLCLRLLRIFLSFSMPSPRALSCLPECDGGCLFGRRPTCTHFTGCSTLAMCSKLNDRSTWIRKVFHIVSFTFELEHKQMTTIDDDTIQAASTANAAAM